MGETRKRRWLRRCLLAFGIPLLLLAITFFGSPLWAPQLVVHLASKEGIAITTAQVDKDDSLVLEKVQWEDGEISFEASKITTLPLWELCRLAMSDGRYQIGAEEVLAITDWKATFQDSGQGSQPAPDSPDDLLRELDTYLTLAARWIPRASAKRGVLVIGTNQFVIPTLSLETSTIKGMILLPRQFPSHLEMRITQANEGAFTFVCYSDPAQLKADLAINLLDDGTLISGTTFLMGGRIDSSLSFPGNAFTPETISAHLENLPVYTSLPDADTSPAGRLNGVIDWDGEQYIVSGDLRPTISTPYIEITNAMPFSLRGNLEQLVVDHANLQSGTLTVDLLEPLAITWTNGISISKSTLKLETKLEDHALAEDLKGNLNMTLRTDDVSDFTLIPRIDFEAATENLFHPAVGRLDISAVGSFQDGIISLKESIAEVTGNPIGVKAKGNLNLATRSFEGLQILAEGDPSSLLPDSFKAGVSQISANLDGSFSNPSASFNASANLVSLPNLLPFDLSAKGTATINEVQFSEIGINTEAAKVSLGGSLTRETGDSSVIVDVARLNWMKEENVPSFTIENPFQVNLRQGKDGRFSRITTSPIQFKGTDLDARLTAKLDLPETGSIQCVLKQMNPSFLRGILNTTVPSLELNQLIFNGQWNNGPLQATASIAGGYAFKEGGVIGMKATANLSPANIRMTDLALTWNDAPGATATLSLPVSIWPGSDRLIRIDESGPIHAELDTMPNSELWTSLERLFSISLRRPNLHVKAKGTLSEPQAEMKLAIPEASLPAATSLPAIPNLPNFENILLECQVTPNALTVSKGSFSMGNQPVHFKGHLPLTHKIQMEASAALPLIDWQTATADIRIPEAEIQAFSEVLPELLQPRGGLSLEASWRNGGLEGEMILTNAATYPFSSFGAVRDIHSRILFEGRQARIQDFTGILGGEPLQVVGQLGYTQAEGLLFDASVTGTNLALVRTPELIVRCDLDLKVGQTNREPALIHGKLNLRNSLLLLDLKSIINSGPEQPESRPPYFSIDTPPLADWKVDIDITGREFMNVRTPVFRGTLSADLKLGGTLKTPYSIGEIQVDKGAALFPFGDIEVDKGNVKLTKENPHLPTLDVTGSSRRFGYDVRFELEGTSEKPDLTFSSTPSLSSKEILLMLTVGEIPSLNYSFSDEDKAGRVAFFFGRDLLQKIGLAPSDEDRLTFRSGDNVTDQGKLTYYIEYRLSDDWSLVGEYDRFNALNAGVKWKVYSK